MKTYGLLGKNISYSFSKGYFTNKFTEESLDCQYINLDLPTIANLPEILTQNTFAGLNVTIPYKESVFQYLNAVDPIAREIGAVNVIHFHPDGTRTGYNSDYYGFKESLLPLLKPNYPKHALILGTGGASKAIAYVLEQLQIKFTYVSRTPKEGQIRYIDLDEAYVQNHQLIINCTPLGTSPNTTQCPDIPYQYLSDIHILYDLVYNPEVTQFMKNGQLHGAKTSNGLQMLRLQAEKAWEIWNT